MITREMLGLIDGTPAGRKGTAVVDPEVRTLFIGGQPNYEPFDSGLFPGVDLGSEAFGVRYNENGIKEFSQAMGTFETGTKVRFDVPVSGLGQTVLFGSATEGRGMLLGPIGQIRREGRNVDAICVAVAESRMGKYVPVALTWTATPDGGNPWSLFPEMNRADVREWNALDPLHPHSAIARLTAIFPPLSGGFSHIGSRLPKPKP